MGPLHPRQLLRTAWRLVVTVVALAYLLVVRSALWVFTLLLMVYFSVNDPVIGASVLTMVNRVIPGTITADRIHWEPFRSRIHVLGVVISRPGDVPVIQASRVTTDMRLGALIANLVVGVNEPVPLLFDRTLVRGGLVDLEFRDDELLLVSAFYIDDGSPPSGGPGVLLKMHDIRIEDARVRLDFFGDWGLDIHEAALDGEVRVEDELVTVRAQEVTARQVAMTGGLPLPDSLAFLVRPMQDFRAARFYLHDEAFEVIRASARAQRFDVDLSGSMAFPSERPLSLDAIATLHVPDPTVLEEITEGTVTGALDGTVRVRGPLESSRLSASVLSGRIEVLGVPFDDVDAEVDLGLSNPTLVRVRRLGCWFRAGRLDAADVLVHAVARPGELVHIGGRACVEGLDGAAAALAFGGYDPRPLSPLLDGAMTGCVGLWNLRVTEEDVSMGLALDVAVGGEPDPRAGLDGAWAAVGDLSLDTSGVKTPGLDLLAGQDRLVVAGELRWLPELVFDLAARGQLPGLARHLEPLAVPGVDGDLEINRLEFVGTLDEPTVHLEAAVEGLQTPVVDLARVALDASLAGGDLVVRRLAWEDPRTDGAVEGDIARVVGPGPVILNSPWRVGLEAVAPIRVPLDLLAPGQGITGEVSLESLFVDGRIGTKIHHLLRDLRLAGEGGVTSLATPAGGVSKAQMQFIVETRREGGMGAPRIGASVQVQAEGLDLAGLGVDALEASVAVQGIPLRFDWATLSMVRGDVSIEARGIKKDFLAFRDLAVALHYPEGGDATIAGKVQVTRWIGARIEGSVAREDLQGHALLRFDRMPVRSVPLPKSIRRELAPISEALVTGQARLDWPALQPLLELPVLEILPQLTMSGDVKAEHLETLPEPVREASASVTLKGGRLDLTNVRVTLASGQGLRGRARLNLDRMTGSGRVIWSPIDLRSLKILADLDLPVRARVGGRLDFEGALARPKVTGALYLQRLQAVGIRLGDAVLDFDGRIGDAVRISSDRFFDGFTLDNALIRFDGLDPAWVEVALGFTDLTLAKLLPDGDLPVAVSATGTAAVTVNTRARGPMVHADLHLEDGGLAVEIPALARLLQAEDEEEAWEIEEEPSLDPDVAFRMVNIGALDIKATERGVQVDCLRLATPFGPVSVAGGVDLRQGYALDVGGAVDLARLAFLSPWLARLKGEVSVGARDACETTGGRFRITGDLLAPEVAGTVSLAGVEFLARGYPQEIRIEQGELALAGRLDTGDLQVRIPEDAPLKAEHEEGAISLWGEMDLADWIPERAALDAAGSNLFFAVPRQFRLTMNPTLHLHLVHPFDPARADGILSGRIDVTEGQYYRNFDLLLGSFATAFSRSQDRYSRPITEVLPFLKAVKLELDIRSTDFSVASRFPFGETDMEVDLDIKARGTLDELELHDRLTLIPGGMIVYKVVKREFEIQSGYADFTGDAGKPALDVKAVTTVNRSAQQTSGTMTPAEETWGRDVNITIHVYGTYPDLRFDLSSDSGEYDQADLQTLLLLGMTRKDLEGFGGEGSGASINLLTDDVAGAVSDLLLSPFLDAVSLGFTREGGIQASTLTKVGRAMQLTTKVAQEADESEYTAGFSFMLTDRLFLEGRMKMKKDSGETKQNYEGRLLYRIPLE